jgi:hypothetical protein
MSDNFLHHCHIQYFGPIVRACMTVVVLMEKCVYIVTEEVFYSQGISVSDSNNIL